MFCFEKSIRHVENYKSGNARKSHGRKLFAIMDHGLRMHACVRSCSGTWTLLFGNEPPETGRCGPTMSLCRCCPAWFSSRGGMWGPQSQSGHAASEPKPLATSSHRAVQGSYGAVFCVEIVELGVLTRCFIPILSEAAYSSITTVATDAALMALHNPPTSKDAPDLGKPCCPVPRAVCRS